MLGWALLTIVFAKADHDINGFHAGPYVTAFLTNIYLAKVVDIRLAITLAFHIIKVRQTKKAFNISNRRGTFIANPIIFNLNVKSTF